MPTNSTVGTIITAKKPVAPSHLPTTTSASFTGAVISVSIVPVVHSWLSRPMPSTGVMKTRIQTIHSNTCRISTGWPGWKSSQKKMPLASRNRAMATYAMGLKK